ncbi:hypothetical protein J3458_016228 [Metarhizium acridum]|uniref:uncharacterized protein n=1 Tax=Metarhizium acridum TaxID=92637 RepID=UPI001C6AFC2C|nr:hypothetical protein J3458_016228 [Metarhizium acridum]
MGDDKELFDSPESNQADGWTSFAIYAGSSYDPWCQIITSSSSREDICLAGGDSGLTITGASFGGSLQGSKDESIGDILGPAENSEVVVPKKPAVRASMYIALQIVLCTTFLLYLRLGGSIKS